MMWTDESFIQSILSDLQRPCEKLDLIRWEEPKKIDVSFTTSNNYEQVVYISIHKNCMEFCIHTTEKKAKKLIAFLKREGTYQNWNKRRTKLMKHLEKLNLYRDLESTLRYMGLIYAEDALQHYMNDLFGKFLIVEQNREENRWDYEHLVF